MSSKSPTRRYSDRVKQLKRRRDHLQARIINYEGTNDSYDRVELSAVQWALEVIESNPEASLELIRKEQP